MLNKEIMHARLGDVKSQSQGGYIRCGNTSMAVEHPPRGIKYELEMGISRGNWPLVAKYLGKTQTINNEAYARRRDATEYVGTRNTCCVSTLC